MGIPLTTADGRSLLIGCVLIIESVAIDIPATDVSPLPVVHHLPSPRTRTPVDDPHASDPAGTSDHELGTEIWASPKSTGNHPEGVAAWLTAGLS